MSFVLYALGALLLAWSGLTIVRSEGFGALDIAATLAGAGAIAVGLGAVAGAIRDLGRQIGAAPPSRPAAVPGLDQTPVLAQKPAAALPPAPTLEEVPVRGEELRPEPAGPSRVEAAMAVKRGLRPAVQVARPRRDPPATADAPEISIPREVVKPAPERRRWPVVEPAPPPPEAQALIPEPQPDVVASEPEIPFQPVASPVEPAAPSGPALERPVALAPAPQRAFGTKAGDTPTFAASTPEWLIRARARREARAQAEADERRAPRPTPADDVPAAKPPVEPEAPSTGVLREGEHNGVTYRFLDDGSIEAESPHGKRRFSSIDDLKATVATARARGELDGPRSDPEQPNDGDALDAAIAALETGPEDGGVSRQG